MPASDGAALNGVGLGNEGDGFANDGLNLGVGSAYNRALSSTLYSLGVNGLGLVENDGSNIGSPLGVVEAVIYGSVGIIVGDLNA